MPSGGSWPLQQGFSSSSDSTGPESPRALKAEIKEECVTGYHSASLRKTRFSFGKHLAVFDSCWVCIGCSIEIHAPGVAELQLDLHVSVGVPTAQLALLSRSLSAVYVQFHLLLRIWAVPGNAVFLGPASALFRMLCSSCISGAGGVGRGLPHARNCHFLAFRDC